MFSFAPPTEDGVEIWMRAHAHQITGDLPKAGFFTGLGRSIAYLPIRIGEKVLSSRLSDDYVPHKDEPNSQGFAAQFVEGISDLAPLIAGGAAVSYALRAIPTPPTQAIGWGVFALTQLIKHEKKFSALAAYMYGVSSKYNESRRDHMHHGIDEGTASQLAWPEAFMGTAALSIPLASPFKSFKSKLISDLAIPTGISMGKRGLMSEILERNGYSEMAKNVKACDMYAVTADILLFSLILISGYQRLQSLGKLIKRLWTVYQRLQSLGRPIKRLWTVALMPLKKANKLLHHALDEAYLRKNILDEFKQVEAGSKLQALYGKLFHRAGASEISLEKKIEAHSREFLAPLEEFTKVGSKNWGLTVDKDFAMHVFKEIHGEDSGNPVSRKLATEYRKVMEEGYRQADEAGIGFKFRENRIPQPMDSYKLTTTSSAKFAHDMMNLVDMERYKNMDGSTFSADQMKNLFIEAFDTNIGLKLQPKMPFKGKLGQKRTHERVFHFKDADSHLAFMEKYGSTTHAVDLLVSDVKSLSRDIVIAREFGPNADTFIRQTMAKVAQEDIIATAGKKGTRDIWGRNKIEVLAKRTESMWDVLHGGDW
ncbi:MAG: hypothetical protein EU981_04685 [Candidatus Liberibacter ctenarytainae]|uniref:Uncharacterized protein n=1 Tax=Candidatus Liberibacter ctenarytainae TaxID=2020335 RepID=A0A937ASS4_9HYPH|nr:hypothetical protein [Candidatus Liberibacter ctenarytainae]